MSSILKLINCKVLAILLRSQHVTLHHGIRTKELILMYFMLNMSGREDIWQVLWNSNIPTFSILKEVFIPWATINPLWPSDITCHHRSWSTWIQTMACCLSGTSHYPTQWWFMVYSTLRNKIQRNLYKQIEHILFKKLPLKMLSEKWQTFCLCLNVLRDTSLISTSVCSKGNLSINLLPRSV